MSLSSNKDQISIVIAGSAGQGIQTVEQIIVSTFKKANFHVYATKEYMSRVRGGVNSVTIRVSSKPVQAFVNKIDLFIPLSLQAITRKFLKRRVIKDTLFLGETGVLSSIDSDNQVIEIPFTDIAVEVGNKIYTNVVAAGAILGTFSVDFAVLEEVIHSFFAKKSAEIITNNIDAAKRGYELTNKIAQERSMTFNIQPDGNVTKDIIINGTEAIALGAIAGGCNFISAYPMSPSTGVLVFLAQHAEKFNIVVHQVEDEIAAINMAIGAWYAGARALVTTSGGGFALMTEGISLSGMTETPVVVHIAQRPGPATGLPTRTEQGDLELAVYAGHGYFPKALFAPGTIEQGFYLTQHAFNLADRYQIPVIILTDQYYVDSYYNTKMFDLSNLKIEQHIIKTSENYKRYEITETGISPRGVPGFGEGLVKVDSDEHDTVGYITEDHDVRIAMVQKRMRKFELLKQDALKPELVGDTNYKILVVGWGSTYPIIKEALKKLNDSDVAFLHFVQVYPIAPNIKKYFAKAEQLILIENNETGQFGKLLKLELDVNFDHRILKYDGLPFSVEEIEEKLTKIIGSA